MDPKHELRSNDLDVEKSPYLSTTRDITNDQSHLTTRLQKWNARIEGLSGFEARGLERVPPDQRSATGLLQMLLLWFSANLTINNLAVALTGPLLFGLGFNDSAWCAIVGVFLGSMSTAYMSTWGAVSGNRTMVRRDARELLNLTRNTCIALTVIGRDKVLYGLLSFQDLRPSQHHPHGRLGDNRLHNRWPGTLSSQRRDDDDSRWCHRRCLGRIRHRCIWHEDVSSLRAVRCALERQDDSTYVNIDLPGYRRYSYYSSWSVAPVPNSIPPYPIQSKARY